MSRLLAVLALTVLVFGCGSGRRTPHNVEITGHDPMKQVKATLQNYVNGQPLTSEVQSFDFLVEEVRKVDTAKADILKAGLDDIKKTPNNPGPKARALLQKLGLDGPGKS
jgi:hypothetical protein